MKHHFLPGIALCFLLLPVLAFSQKNDSLMQDASLSDCIGYALRHQPLIRQSQIDEAITENTIKGKLADWYPQINFTYNLQHYLKLPTSFIPDVNGLKRPVTLGVQNSSTFQFAGTQAIFNRDVLLASRTAGAVRQQSKQVTASNKIDVVVEVSKAYYDLLLTEKQVQALDENIVRLERSFQDAYNQYQGGLVDKTDYKRAQIALNNTRADRKRVFDLVSYKAAYLKQLMGYPMESPVRIIYDSLQMEKDAIADTLQKVSYNNRIEYQLLQTRQNLLQANVAYNRWSYLPAVSAFGNYTPSFQNERLPDLYNNNYPTSLVGIQVAVPLFQGNKRVYNIRTANLQLTRLDWDVAALTKQIEAEYTGAMAAYKGNLAEWSALKENLALAADVYNTLRLQYAAGIKTYLDVIIAETDLRTAQLNYLNALYNVLASKLDMQKALGTIRW